MVDYDMGQRRHVDISICISSTFVHAIYIIIFDGWIYHLYHMPRSYIGRGVDDGKRCKYTRLFTGVWSEWLKFSVIASHMSKGLFLDDLI